MRLILGRASIPSIANMMSRYPVALKVLVITSPLKLIHYLVMRSVAIPIVSG